MNIPKLKICNKSPHENPTYAKPGDSGMDLRAWITNDAPIVLKPLERVLIHTGIYLEIPEGYEVQVRPKSGQALKKGITVLNSPGTVDVNFRGEICVIINNLSNDNVTIEDGEKIAQMVMCPVQHEGLVSTEYVDEISTDTERGAGGFGHTGIH
jgi:dUTP pyrophosphatase